MKWWENGINSGGSHGNLSVGKSRTDPCVGFLQIGS